MLTFGSYKNGSIVLLRSSYDYFLYKNADFLHSVIFICSCELLNDKTDDLIDF